MARHKRIVQESLKANASLTADADGIRLYDMAKELKITPVQAVARYFIHGKGHYKVRRDYEGLLKILSLLKECDWEYDPAVKVNEGDDIRDVKNRWIVWDRDRPDHTISTEIRCTEDVVERFLKPLLGETFNVAGFLQKLVGEEISEREAVEIVSDRITTVQQAGGHATAALELKGQFAKDGNPHGNRDVITVRSVGDGGTSAAYLAARLKKAKRDDLLAEIGPGKRFKSVRAAAIEAEIIKPVPTVRLVDDPIKVAISLRKHLSPQQIHALCEALLSTLN